MDAELKAFLEGMETRFADRVDAAEERLLARVMERVGGRIDASEERMKDFVRISDTNLETKLIAEFWKWGRTSDLRTKQAMADVSTLNERVLAVEDRILALERRTAS
jgi:hypothetical protein